jgi:predicted amino acid dehydrogenase
VGEADEKGGFIFPNMEKGLLVPDMEMRDSVKQATRKIIESMSKIFERGDGGGRFGLLGRRTR